MLTRIHHGEIVWRVLVVLSLSALLLSSSCTGDPGQPLIESWLVILFAFALALAVVAWLLGRNNHHK